MFRRSLTAPCVGAAWAQSSSLPETCVSDLTTSGAYGDLKLVVKIAVSAASRSFEGVAGGKPAALLLCLCGLLASARGIAGTNHNQSDLLSRGNADTSRRHDAVTLQRCNV